MLQIGGHNMIWAASVPEKAIFDFKHKKIPNYFLHHMVTLSYKNFFTTNNGHVEGCRFSSAPSTLRHNRRREGLKRWTKYTFTETLIL